MRISQYLFDPHRAQFCGELHPIRIYVAKHVELPAADRVALHEQEGRALHDRFHAERAGEPFGEGGLAGAEIAVEREHLAALECGGDLRGERVHLFF